MKAFNTTPITPKKEEEPNDPKSQTAPTTPTNKVWKADRKPDETDPCPDNTKRESTTNKELSQIPSPAQTKLDETAPQKKKTKSLLILGVLILATTTVIILNKNTYKELFPVSKTLQNPIDKPPPIVATKGLPEYSFDQDGEEETILPEPETENSIPDQTTAEISEKKEETPKNTKNQTPKKTKKKDATTLQQANFKILDLQNSEADPKKLYVLVKNKTLLETRNPTQAKKILASGKGKTLTVNLTTPTKASQKKFGEEREKLQSTQGIKTFLVIEEITEIK